MTRGQKKKSRMLMKEMLIALRTFLQVVARAHNEGMMKKEKNKRVLGD